MMLDIFLARPSFLFWISRNKINKIKSTANVSKNSENLLCICVGKHWNVIQQWDKSTLYSTWKLWIFNEYMDSAMSTMHRLKAFLFFQWHNPINTSGLLHTGASHAIPPLVPTLLLGGVDHTFPDAAQQMFTLIASFLALRVYVSTLAS